MYSPAQGKTRSSAFNRYISIPLLLLFEYTNGTIGYTYYLKKNSLTNAYSLFSYDSTLTLKKSPSPQAYTFS